MWAKERYSQLKKSTAKFYNHLTGGTVEESVDEYAEIYGEVLLGMHRDLQKHGVSIKSHESSMQQGLATVNQIKLEMTKDVAKVEQLLAGASIASQTALKAAASADSAANRSDKSATECGKTANEAEQNTRGLITRLKEQEQQLERFRNEYQKFRSRVIWVLCSAAALVLIGVIPWILHLRG